MFHEEIAPYVQKYAPQYGICVCSPIIAQAILESASGTSALGKVNNFFGLKYRKGRCPTSNGTITKEGSEQNPDGSYISSNMLWFTFPSMDAGVQGYFDFINISNYANVKGVTDPQEYLTKLRSDGYATSLNYVKNLMAVIDKYNLTQYDNVIVESKPIQANSGGKKMVFNVHAGHAAPGQGAIGAVGLISESVEDRLVKDKVIEKLRAQGHTVYDCTVDSGTQSAVLSNIVKKCNAHNVDLDISIHFNSGANRPIKDGVTTGTEVFIYSATTKCKGTAQSIVNEIAKLGFKNRGVKTSKSLYFLNKTKSEAVLIECCFVDDGDDVALYNAEKMAEAIVVGITGKASAATSAPAATPQPAASTTTPAATNGTATNKVVKLKTNLNVRSGPGISYSINTEAKKGLKYTIVEVKGSWGKLKSGAGWINISTAYVTYC